MNDSRFQVLERRLGLVPSPFPFGMADWFLGKEIADEIRLRFVWSEVAVEAVMRETTFQGKKVIIIDGEFGEDAKIVAGAAIEGHVFLRQYVYKGYKSLGEEWVAQINSKELRENMGILDEARPEVNIVGTPAIQLRPKTTPLPEFYAEYAVALGKSLEARKEGRKAKKKAKKQTVVMEEA
jgi:hypothetical protein